MIMALRCVTFCTRRTSSDNDPAAFLEMATRQAVGNKSHSLAWKLIPWESHGSPTFLVDYLFWRFLLESSTLLAKLPISPAATGEYTHHPTAILIPDPCTVGAALKAFAEPNTFNVMWPLEKLFRPGNEAGPGADEARPPP